MNTRWLNLLLASVFLMAGIISAVNMIQLNAYIKETIPRDAQQESCQLTTLQALRVWAVARKQIEDAKEARDAALIPLWHQLELGEKIRPDVAAEAEKQFANVDRVRSNVEEMLSTTPIPQCHLFITDGGGK